ncbi:MAG TPA: metal ABC transporter substrate-binding protein [Chloroflexia bacterium]|nr:metal ABC transporter substrate-binding protein [Chloroflexia bacterium]
MNFKAFGKQVVLPVIIAICSIALVACGDNTTPSVNGTSAASNASQTTAGVAGKLRVVATTTQLADFARNVGGERVEVTSILKPSADAHEYEPTAADSKALAASQLILKNGLGLDDWLDKTIQSSGTKALLVTASEGVKTRKAEGSLVEEFKNGDPHIWFSSDNAKKMVDNIATGLLKVDPSSSDIYQANASAYKAQLDQMAQQIKALIANIPAENRKLVTNHDAFGYFIDQFGLTFVGSVIPSMDSTSEPSARDIEELVNKIKEQKVKAIFTEQSLNPRLAEQISREAGVKIYSNLYSDSLSEPGSDGDTYLKMMLSNARNIVAGLK